MSFTGALYLFAFLPIALFVYYISNERLREYVLLALSIVFYTFGELHYIRLLLILMAFTVILGRMIAALSAQWIRRLLLIAGICANIGILFRYKYLIAFSDPAYKPLLPLGISFYTFKAVSYLADVYKGEAVPGGTPVVHDALYLSFFAQIQSGPLTRYKCMVSSPDRKLFSEGVYRFLAGFSKKILIADVLAHVTGGVFSSSPDTFTAGYAWLGSVCFSLQLYYDFSGYSDMAVGMSKMFGYDCIENFNYPYMTESVSRFWRRWHISLSEWFRDYVYIPLGGSRTKSRLRVYLNLFAVWFLTGIWHGLEGNFIIWGLGYFVLIAFERLTGLPDKLNLKISKVLYRIFVLFFINCQWIMFRASDINYGLGFIKHLFIRGNSALTDARTRFLLSDYGLIIAIAVILCFPVSDMLRRRLKEGSAAEGAYQYIHAAVVIAAFVVSLSFLVSGSNNPFVYANF